MRIGHLTRTKGIPTAQIGDPTSLGSANTFTATREFTTERGQAERGNPPTLRIGPHVGISMSIPTSPS